MKLNKNLQGVADGLTAASVYLLHGEGPRHHIGRVYVYWPFVVFKTVWDDWNITHAPTGRHLRTMTTLGKAVDLVLKIRTASDWEFTSVTARKAQRARRASVKLLPPLYHAG